MRRPTCMLAEWKHGKLIQVLLFAFAFAFALAMAMAMAMAMAIDQDQCRCKRDVFDLACLCLFVENWSTYS